MKTPQQSLFWEDLDEDLQDVEARRTYFREYARIKNVDAIINALDDARLSAGLNKAELARRLQTEPAAIRRLFSAVDPNPTIGTLAEVAAALGMRIALEPLPASDKQIAAALAS